MSKELILERISPEPATEIGRIGAVQTLIGRDPGEGIVLDLGSVSRQHGAFYKVRNHWLFKDLGSTNGSWVNGVQVQPDRTRLVRPGDLLQLADIALRIKLPVGDETVNISMGQAFNASTLIVFQNDQFFDEFPLPEYGRALVVGGPQADLKLDNEDPTKASLPSLVVERRGDTAVAYGVSPEIRALLNGVELVGNQKLSDSDELRIGSYVVLFNDPRTVAPTPSSQPKPVQVTGRPSDMFGSGAAVSGERPRIGTGAWSMGAADVQSATSSRTDSSSTRLAFGQSGKANDDVEGTRALDPAEIEARLAGFDMHPAGRHRLGHQQTRSALSSFEDRLIVILGIVMLAGVVCAFLFWWFL